MDERTRNWFDHHLDQVIRDLPAEVHTLIDQVPLVVDDYPSRHLLDSVDLTDPLSLCGLYTGVPLSSRELLAPITAPEQIYIFRGGIIAAARVDRAEYPSLDIALRDQIRITILHEYGHHFGMTEEDLDELGYG